MEKERPNSRAAMAAASPSPSPSSAISDPWKGLLHPQHEDSESEGLLRTLRFAGIQLNKFWVEVNAFPVFMNEMKGASIRQIEALFDWFQAAPSWASRVGLPRLVPELCSESTRKPLLEFTSRAVRARMLRANLARRIGARWPDTVELQASLPRLEVAGRLAQELGLEGKGLGDVDGRIQELSGRLERNGRLQAFFSRLSSEFALGAEATRLSECGRVLQAMELVRHTPLEVWSWRKPQLLAAQNRTRILAWQERARPLVEARRRLQPVFRFDERVAAAQLRLLAEKIAAGGVFRALSADYKEAVRRYRELLKLDKGAKPPKQSPQQMAEALNDWAGYLERRAQIEDHAEVRALFGPHFKGIDTNFDAALEANTWASQVRTELESEDKGEEAHFCSRLVDALLEASQEKLLQALEACGGAGMQAIQGILAEPCYASNREFAVVACDEEARLLQANELREHLTAVGWLESTPLSELAAIRAAACDLLALLQGIDGCAEARAAFKQAFAGEHTDLGLLAGAQDYIDFVSGAALSDSLRASFLTAHGPQRLHDTRALVAPALAGLALVKEHLRRLEVATRGQSRSLEELPLLDLIHRIQHALKHPGFLRKSQDPMLPNALQ